MKFLHLPRDFNKLPFKVENTTPLLKHGATVIHWPPVRVFIHLWSHLVLHLMNESSSYMYIYAVLCFSHLMHDNCFSDPHLTYHQMGSMLCHPIYRENSCTSINIIMKSPQGQITGNCNMPLIEGDPPTQSDIVIACTASLGHPFSLTKSVPHDYKPWPNQNGSEREMLAKDYKNIHVYIYIYIYT